ncbi:DUF1042-domain-containing protein [Fimicolochytrium jonesii]|uniref:DUF1042-domain-containing protein n=1 Tax=Fimicolochytrium jonesii TaxID=1396493 RepID=UPI0022FEA984|nr:DUF1042-domain-containing protein [Fimicolochytrium jonesii]KAI8821725.1 DUF1042-domain-containing protein [Fimicolochytrium jonesii]
MASLYTHQHPPAYPTPFSLPNHNPMQNPNTFPSALPLNPTTQPSVLPLPVNSSTTTEEEDPNDAIYTWVDSIPLSRPKRNIQRDFSDGVATAEVIHHYIPKLVDLHNYPPANGVKQKLYNWATLDQKVFRRLGLRVDTSTAEAIVKCTPGVVEGVLRGLKDKIEAYLARHHRSHSSLNSYSHLNSSNGSMASLDAAHSQANLGVGAGGMIAPAHGDSGYAYTTQQMGGPIDVGYAVSPQHHHQQQQIQQLTETVGMLQHKVERLEELVSLKERQVEGLGLRLRAHGLE